jgi:hypothetical protein
MWKTESLPFRAGAQKFMVAPSFRVRKLFIAGASMKTAKALKKRVKEVIRAQLRIWGFLELKLTVETYATV